MIRSVRLFGFVSGIIFLLMMISTARAFTLDASALQNQLARLSAMAPVEINLSDLQRFYLAREYQPVWIQADQPAALFDDALAYIEAADAEGLNSNDYQLQSLRQLQSLTHHTAETLIELELRATEALLMLACDLRNGHLDISRADPDWHIPQQPFDPVPFLLDAIVSEDLPGALAGLTPEIPSYQLMKQALARYRELVANQVTWTKIPVIPLIRPNTEHSVIPLIRKRITEAYAMHGMAEYNISEYADNQYDGELVNAIKTFQARHGLNTDGIIGKNTLRALNVTPEDKIKQLRLNMERLRWLPRNLGERYLLVNIAGFRLAAVEQGRHILDMRIIVGRDYRSTPSFSSQVTHIIVNPFWNIPASIARKDLLPKQQRDPTFFTKQSIKVYQGYNYDSKPLNPDTIDWQAMKKGFPYVLRQDPGIKNALGSIKFMFPNLFSIYLHDTPSRSLFQRDIRAFSSGCIRLEEPIELAGFALNKSYAARELISQLRDGKTTTMSLPKSLPIYIVYLTTWIDDQNKIYFSPDTYGRDARALEIAGW